MSPVISRFLLRFGIFRFCVLTYHRKERKQQEAVRAEYRRSVVTQIGHITMTWAGLEMIIDHLISWYHPLNGRETIHTDQPKTFHRKLEYLNKMARDDGFDEGGKHNIRLIRTEAKRLNNWRRAIIHGVIRHTHFSTDWIVHIRDFDGPNSQLMSYKLKNDDFATILSQMSALMLSMSPFVEMVTGLDNKASDKTKSAKSA
jgi:hypothetical protein